MIPKAQLGCKKVQKMPVPTLGVSPTLTETLGCLWNNRPDVKAEFLAYDKWPWCSYMKFVWGLKCAQSIAAWSFSQIEISWKMAVQKHCDAMLENEMYSLDCEPAWQIWWAYISKCWWRLIFNMHTQLLFTKTCMQSQFHFLLKIVRRRCNREQYF